MSDSVSSNQEFIIKLTEIVLTNLSVENFGVDELIEKTGLSSSIVRHRLKTITQKTISQFINEVKLNKALEILQNESLTASEVAYKVGFSSPAYFNNCFHDFFGYSPGEVKKRLTVSEENHKTTEPATQNGNSVKKEKKNKKRKTRRWVFIVAATIALIGIFSWLVYLTYYDNFPRLTRKNYRNIEKSIAVLPFVNLGNNEEDYWFTESIMDDIINRLYEIKQLNVKSRTSVEQFRNTTLSVPEIGKKLGVNFIIEGSVSQSDGKVRVFVRLIDAINDKLLLAEPYDGNLEEKFNIQSEIAKQVAEELQAALTPDEIKAIEQRPVRNEEAHTYYLMGRNSINKTVGDEEKIGNEDILNALKFYQTSIGIDSGYSMAYAGLAETYYLMGRYDLIPREQGFKKAKENAFYALQLNKNQSEAHIVLGRLYTYYEWNWEEARKQFKLAIKEDSNNPFAHAYYSELLDILGDDAAARKEINLALKYDRMMYFFYKQSVAYYFNEGKLDKCLEEIHNLYNFQTVQMSSIPWTECYVYDRQNEDTIAIEKLNKILHSEVPEIDFASKLDLAYQKEGSTGVVRFMLNYLKQDPNYPQYFLAQIYGRIGNKKEAIKCLRNSLEKREIVLPHLNNDPRLVYIRKEPYFREVIEKLGLGPYFNPDKDFSPVAD